MELNDKNEAQVLKDIASGNYRSQYLLYVRKSTDEPENQKNSITFQKTEGARFSKREDLPVAEVTIAGFCLDGVISEKHSGFKENNDLTFTKSGMVQYHINRPKFQKLVQYLSQGLFKGVICLCWDRISRNKGDDTLVRKLMRKGIDVRFVYANYDKTSAGELHMDIDGMFAGHHSRVTSEKVRIANESLRERGLVTYKAPIGYLNSGSPEHKPFDPERAPIIKKMFELYATGDWSLADLERFAGNQGIVSVPTRRHRTPAEMLAEEEDQVKIEKTSHPLTFSHISKILNNPFYAGRIPGNGGKYIRSASHEALVSEELFGKVQQVLKKRKVSLHYTQKLRLPFRGLVRCECGRVYTPYVQKNIQYFGSRCQPGCTNPKKSFNVEFLEQGVAGLMDGLIMNDEQRTQLDADTAEEIARLEKKHAEKLEIGQRAEKKIREDLGYLKGNKLQLLKTGVYTPETFLQEEVKLHAALSAIQDERAVSELSMRAAMESVIKLSELLKVGSALYSHGESPEMEAMTKIVFSELYISQSTLRYQCTTGFKPLENRSLLLGGPTGWLSEALRCHNETQDCIEMMEELLKNNPPRGP